MKTTCWQIFGKQELTGTAHKNASQSTIRRETWYYLAIFMRYTPYNATISHLGTLVKNLLRCIRAIRIIIEARFFLIAKIGNNLIVHQQENEFINSITFIQ